jgi:hypothetical protein
MKKEKIKTITDSLEQHLSYAQELWNTKEKSDAFIIGYLESTIKYAIKDLTEK